MNTLKFLCVLSAMMVFTVSAFACGGSKDKEEDKRIEITRTLN